MVIGRIEQGQLTLDSAIPVSWEGQFVKVVPCTPDDPIPDLEVRLAALHALGPMEFDRGETEGIGQALAEMNRLSLNQMKQVAGQLT